MRWIKNLFGRRKKNLRHADIESNARRADLEARIKKIVGELHKWERLENSKWHRFWSSMENRLICETLLRMGFVFTSRNPKEDVIWFHPKLQPICMREYHPHKYKWLKVLKLVGNRISRIHETE